MVARMHPLFSRAPIAMFVVALVGAVTAFYAATIALVQTDIKKVLAYSTVSQLGYMFLGCGVGAVSYTHLSARLSRLRQGRRVRIAGYDFSLRAGPQPLQ